MGDASGAVLSDDCLDAPLARNEADATSIPVEDDHAIATGILGADVLDGTALGKANIAAGVGYRLADRLHAGARTQGDGLNIKELP